MIKKKSAVVEPEKQLAKENIEVKLRILRDWISEGFPERLDAEGIKIRNVKTGEVEFDFAPTSQSTFLRWKAASNCDTTQRYIEKRYGVSIRGTGQGTLDHYDDLKEEVFAVTKAVKNKLKSDQKPRVKSNVIAELRDQINHLEDKVKITEIRYRQLLQEINETNEKLNDEIQSHESSKAIWRKDVEVRDEEIASLKDENRRLINSLAKISPLKKV